MRLALAALISVAALAGPVEFGSAELERAFAERRLNPRAFRIKTEVALDPAESYHIVPGLITGGDMRGLMYGLMEAADQIRATGHLKKASGAPALAIRGVRMVVKDPGETWFQSREYWQVLFQAMARARFNRFHLALAQVDNAAGTLKLITQLAGDYGVDFTLGIWGVVEGQPAAQMQTMLGELLSQCPAIRSVQLRLEPEAAMYALRAAHDAGRRVIVEAPATSPIVSGAAESIHVPVRVACAYPGAAPAAASTPFYWEIPITVKSDTATVRSLLAGFAAAHAGGFELDLAPGAEGAAAVAKLPWGRLGYDPQGK